MFRTGRTSNIKVQWFDLVTRNKNSVSFNREATRIRIYFRKVACNWIHDGTF
jgi:hypothetical protein